MRHGKLQYGSFWGRGGLKTSIFCLNLMFFDVQSYGNQKCRGVSRIRPYWRPRYANKDEFCFNKLSHTCARIFATADLVSRGISCLYFASHRHNIRPRAMKLIPQLDFCLRIPTSQKFWKSDHYWLNCSILTNNKL